MASAIKAATKTELAKISDDVVLKKGSGIIQIRVLNGERRSLLGRKLSNALFKIAQKEGLDLDAYTTTRLEVNELVKFNSNDVSKLKQAANELTSLKVELDVTNNDSGVRTVGATQLFSAVLFQSSGKIIFEIPQLAKRMLADSQRFALINMQVQGDLDSNYSFILYEQCLLYIDEGKTPEFSVDDWRKIFECSEDSIFQQFKFFNQKIIKHAVEEVNRVTDILVNPVFTKEKRVVVSFHFEISWKPQYLLDFSPQDDKLRAEEKLIQCGVTEAVAYKLVREYEYEQIMGNIEYAEAQLAEDKIKNLAGYVVEAIKGDWRPKQSPIVEKHEAARAKSKQDEIERQKKAAEEQASSNKLAEERNRRAGDYYEKLSEVDREALFKKFEGHLSKSNPTLHKSYIKNGIEAKTVRMALLQFISSSILTE